MRRFGYSNKFVDVIGSSTSVCIPGTKHMKLVTQTDQMVTNTDYMDENGTINFPLACVKACFI